MYLEGLQMVYVFFNSFNHSKEMNWTQELNSFILHFSLSFFLMTNIINIIHTGSSILYIPRIYNVCCLLTPKICYAVFSFPYPHVMKACFSWQASRGTAEVWMTKKMTKLDITHNGKSIFPALKHCHVTGNTSSIRNTT